ncbi:aquaporin-9-like [Protopterus annectens]|uniref:aquaporin-9-like n=1 Tax=Protopterus annectens TaxID=7888 RepID=UPI001CFC3C81|nr:aquaporin-9-like [Protopterus annectens]
MGFFCLFIKMLKKKFATQKPCLRFGLAEFLGTYILILFGCGSVAQMELSGYEKAQFLSVNMAWGFAVTAGAYVAAGVSGAHLNPAVSFAMCLLGRMTWMLLPVYCVSQFAGAFLGAVTVFGLYYDALHTYSEGNWTVTGPMSTAGIFATYPSDHLSITNGFADQVIATAALLACILAITDEQNCPAPKGLQPFLIGVIVQLVGMSMGLNCGYPINPARDLAPRAFTAIAGWGFEVFEAGNHWWWVPVIGPMVGAVVGTLAYVLFIEIHHPTDTEMTSGTVTRRNKPSDSRKTDPPEYELVQTAA